MSKSVKKSFIDDELRTRKFVPGPVDYNTFVNTSVLRNKSSGKFT